VSSNSGGSWSGEGGSSDGGDGGGGAEGASFAQRMMSQMGYRGSGGLGARGTGIAAPVEAHMDRLVSQTGLGYSVAVQSTQHTYEELKPEPRIAVEWVPRLDRPPPPPPAAEEEDFTAGAAVPTPSSWASVGPAQMSYLDPSFCPLDVQEKLFRVKSVFDTVGDKQFLSARDRSNPFELLKKEIFQNRAALKMAEIDAACGKLFTQPPVFLKQHQKTKKRELLYFGDVCAGPGGFTEFMLTVGKWRSMGFGFTLRGKDDFKTDNFNPCAPPHSFKAYYGVDNSGDVTNSDNLRDYARHVWSETKGQGLHVMLADGGFSVSGKENYQELLTRQLVLCQFTAAVATLREGGVFVCKLFDTFLRFTVDCLYLMRLAFHDVALIKPNQSRPANSERYIVCRGLRAKGGLEHPIVRYMLRVNDKMNALDPLGAQMSALEAKIAEEARINAAAAAAGKAAAAAARARGESAEAIAAADDAAYAAAKASAAGEDGTTGDSDGDNKPQLVAFVRGGVIGAGAEEATAQGAGEPYVPPHAEAYLAALERRRQQRLQQRSGPGAGAGARAAPRQLRQRETVTSLVPAHVLDAAFVSYVSEWNERYARVQTRWLERVREYLEDQNLPPDDQEKIRLECLELWRVPPCADKSKPDGVVYLPPNHIHWDAQWGSKRFGSEQGRKEQNRLFGDDDRHVQWREFVDSTVKPALTPPFYNEVSLDAYLANAGTAVPTLAAKLKEVSARAGDAAARMAYAAAVAEAGANSARVQPPPGPRDAMAPIDGSKYFVVLLPSGSTRAALMVPPAARREHVLVLPADARQGARCESERTGLSLPPDTVVDVYRQGNSFLFLDAWALPYPGPDEVMYRARPRYQDRLEVLSLFVEAVREPRVMAAQPVPLAHFVNAFRPEMWPPGYDALIFRGDGVRPQPSFRFRSGQNPADVSRERGTVVQALGQACVFPRPQPPQGQRPPQQQPPRR
jgi:23S rRNA U2552 (ribose-2'-O)-methylase RlmE/FtsJ